MRRIGLALVSGVIAMAVTAPAEPPAQEPMFEVASIKRQLPPIRRSSFELQGGRFVTEGLPAKYLLMRAFGVPKIDILGAPDWLDSDFYRIEAKVDGVIPPDEFPRMLQSLLMERFQLKAHRETRELPVFELLVARGGPKLSVSEDQTPADPPAVTGERLPANATMPRGAFGFSSGSASARAVPLSRLTDHLRFLLGRTVIDKTGLIGLFDFELRWTPGSEQTLNATPGALLPQGDVSGPSLFTALQEQLGVRLQAATAPLEVIVIDGVQRPSEN
jgi:uncharacterized protein (TIGR03435 family)